MEDFPTQKELSDIFLFNPIQQPVNNVISPTSGIVTSKNFGPAKADAINMIYGKQNFTQVRKPDMPGVKCGGNCGQHEQLQPNVNNSLSSFEFIFHFYELYRDKRSDCPPLMSPNNFQMQVPIKISIYVYGVLVKEIVVDFRLIGVHGYLNAQFDKYDIKFTSVQFTYTHRGACNNCNCDKNNLTVYSTSTSRYPGSRLTGTYKSDKIELRTYENRSEIHMNGMVDEIICEHCDLGFIPLSTL